jgi:hypothetical protein
LLRPTEAGEVLPGGFWRHVGSRALEGGEDEFEEQALEAQADTSPRRRKRRRNRSVFTEEVLMSKKHLLCGTPHYTLAFNTCSRGSEGHRVEFPILSISGYCLIRFIVATDVFSELDARSLHYHEAAPK